MLSDSVAGVDCQPLTRREKVAQTVMTGIEATSATPATIELVARHAGSVILFGDNIVDGEQLLRLTRSLRRHARARLLVAVDEEGGRVSRLGEKGIVDRLPSARELSRTKTTDQIHRLATRLGEQMAAVGMDWNLAPVLDVADADASTVIGDRSFSGNPDRVAAVGRAFAAGLRRGGVMSTGKHFPGHGRTTTDSHETLPTVTASLPQLRRRDIKPFKAALPALDAVMSAHVRYTAIDRRRPASLSPAATRILRRDLGYEGILITDALQMGAITQRWTVPQAAEKAIRAGADVVLSGDPATTPAVTARLTQAVADGRISKVRLHQAVTRVLRAKGYGDPRIGCLLGG
jgi:beta-N-acetylhexosaminidase